MHPDDMPQDGAEIKPFARAQGRWIALYVDIFDHPIVGAHIPAPAPADPKRASWQPMVMWVWLTAQANFRPYAYDVNGKVVHLNRGQLVLSERHLGRVCNWTRKISIGWLAKLERHGMIETVTTRPDGQLALDFVGSKQGPAKGPTLTIVTICNYGKYQFPPTQQGANQGASKGPGRGHYLTRDTDTRKKKKESKPAREEYDAASLRADDAVISDLIEWHASHDEAGARQWLNHLIGCHGEGPCREAYNKVKTRIASGKKKVKSPIGLWGKIAKDVATGDENPENAANAKRRERMREARRANGEQPRE